MAKKNSYCKFKDTGDTLFILHMVAKDLYYFIILLSCVLTSKCIIKYLNPEKAVILNVKPFFFFFLASLPV